MGADSLSTDYTTDLDEQIAQLTQCKPLSEQQVLYSFKLNRFVIYANELNDSYLLLKQGLDMISIDIISDLTSEFVARSRALIVSFEWLFINRF